MFGEQSRRTGENMTAKCMNAPNNFMEARAGETPATVQGTVAIVKAVAKAHGRLEAKGLLYNGSWRKRRV